VEIDDRCNFANTTYTFSEEDTITEFKGWMSGTIDTATYFGFSLTLDTGDELAFGAAYNSVYAQ
jgi:hypothetical protein